MSKIAKKIAAAPATTVRIKRGPDAACFGLYEPDIEDAAAIEEFRRRAGESWATAQAMFDNLAGAPRKIPNDKFRYHWRRRCYCWPDEHRNS